MTKLEDKLSRRDQILQSLAHMLETQPGARITTANLAREVGVSEAALYRHFPSKAKMLEGLISFIEETIFSRITRILADVPDALGRLEHTLTLVLTFAEKNPGMCRLLSGDALSGETERLHHRIHQLFERLETQLRQILRDAELHEGLLTVITATATANLLTAIVEGRIRQYVRSEFSQMPTARWDEQWQLLQPTLLRERRT